MSKKFITIILVIVLLITAGCTPHEEPAVSIIATTKHQQTAVPVLKSNQVKLIFDSSDTNSRKIENVGWLGFIDNYSFGLSPIRAKDGESIGDKYVLNDLKKGITYPINTPKEMKNETVSSGVQVIMKRRYLYEWQNVSVNNQDVNKFIRIDAKERKMVVLDSRVTYSPFIYLSKLNEDEFITSLCGRGTEKNTSISIVTKYNVNTGKNTELINEVYQNLESDVNSKGLLLESVTAMDGKIYGFGRKRVNGKYLYYLYIFDENGKLKKTINAQELEKALNNTKPVTIFVVGDYLIFNNWNLVCYIYKIEDNGVRFVVGGDENICYFSNMENFYDSSKYKYIFYTHQCTGDGDHRDNYLFGIELATGKTKKIDVQIDNEKKYLSYSRIDEDGNMILDMVPDHLESMNIREYYVANETLMAMFEKAPYID